MARYHADHLRRLLDEADNRFRELLRALDTWDDDNTFVTIDGVRIRLAVDDFKVILAEIRRLK